MSNTFRFVVSRSHQFVIRERPGRWILMFIWLRIDPTVRLWVICMPQIALLEISFLFHASFHNSLALLGAVDHPRRITSLHHHHRCWTSLACSSSPRIPRFPLAWTSPVPVNTVYLKGSMPYCWTCSLLCMILTRFPLLSECFSSFILRGTRMCPFEFIFLFFSLA